MEPIHSVRITDAVYRLKGVFLEMPGTQLTVTDAERLSGLDSSMCLIVLETLEDAGFVRRTSAGAFIRQ